MLMINAMFVDNFSSSRLLLGLIVLLTISIFNCPRLLFSREAWMYGCFILYMLVSLFWTFDLLLALNTLFPAVDFLLILVLFGSLTRFRRPRDVLAGVVGGVVVGACIHIVSTGFPFVIPPEFSYNAIALMYVFGLIALLLYGCERKLGITLLLLVPLILVLIAATTSIKAVLGIVIGVVGAAIFFFDVFVAKMRKAIVPIAFGLGAVIYSIFSNEALTEHMKYAFARVAVGIEVLEARDDIPGYGGFDERQEWAEIGLEGWLRNPLFGSGVEAFRHDLGVTSHSTPVDLLYNSGLVGLMLFYGLFLSVVLRIFRAPRKAVAPVMFGASICFCFMSISGIAHYNTFIAAVLGMGIPLLEELELT